MKIELINTGSELLLGRVLNTHQHWICRRMADLGYVVDRQTCVADDGHSIQAAVREALGRADLVITTGGLGPTSDDITRELIAQLLGRRLILDKAVLAHIEDYFRVRKRAVPANFSDVQSMVPEGAIVLPNNHGTAPGLAMKLEPNPCSGSGRAAWLILLPGPPRELHPMFLESVIPLLVREMPLGDTFVCRTLRSAGIGESMVANKIDPELKSLVKAGLEIGYCARIGEVDVRLIARGSGAEEIVRQSEVIVRGLVGEAIFGVDDDSLESVVVRRLAESQRTLALAESCTGGFIAHRITNVSGASAVFMGGMVTYSNESKMKFLGVQEASLKEYGAVSEVVAREMAEGARRRLGTDFALAVTGIAGPTGGSESKPVGTVFVALAQEGQTIVQRQLNPFDRETFKFITSEQALTLLRTALKENHGM